MKKKSYEYWQNDYPNHMVIMKEGKGYRVRGEGAVVLSNLMGYNIENKEGNCITETLVIGPALQILKSKRINYVVIDNGVVIKEYSDDNSTYSLLIEYQSLLFEMMRKNRNLQRTVYFDYDDENISMAEMMFTIDTILRGVDPTTGEYIEEDSLFHDRVFKRVLSYAKDSLERKQKREESLPLKAGQKWSDDEDEQLRIELKNGMKLKEISGIHGRTEWAISSRILKKHPEFAFIINESE